MITLKYGHELIVEGNALLEEIQVNPATLLLSDNILTSIHNVVSLRLADHNTQYVSEKFDAAKRSCMIITELISNKKNDKLSNSKLKHHLTRFKNLLDLQHKIIFSKTYNLPDEAINKYEKFSIELESAIKKLENTEISLLATLNDVKIAQEDLSKLDNETEQRTQRLLEEAQRSIQARVDDGNENIRTTLQSVRDELDIRASRAENTIDNLIAGVEHKNKIYESDIKDLFKAHEKESTNRIEVRIQRAEGIAANLTKQAADAKELYSDITSDQKESLYVFIEDSKKSLNDSIRKTSADASQRVQKAQTDAQDSFNKFLNENITSINERIESKVSEYDALKEKMESTFQEKISSLETQLSIVTSGVMADQHIKQANTERKAYWAFQLTGFAFMLAAIYAGSLFFSELTNIKIPFLPKPDLVIHIDGALNSGPSPITLMFMRLSMIILLTAPALYLLKEAALHRHKENLYRQRGIQLATISPYLEELEKEERAMIKKELVSSFFNFHDGKADTQNVPDFIRDMKEAVGIAKSLNGQTKTVSQRFNRKEK